jgi:Tol biopolymer transport system component
VPMLSPDGSKVAYMSTRGGESPDLWVMDRDGRQAVQLSSQNKVALRASWFPTGNRIAFLSSGEQGPALWNVNVSTRREELMLDSERLRHSGDVRDRRQLTELDFAPSLKQVAFSMRTPPLGRRVLFVSALDHFTPRALTDAGVSAGYPAWSPDERSIAVEVKDGPSTQAAIVDVQSGTLRRLTNAPGQTWVRSWSPDGRKIAVAALRRGTWTLQWIDVETGKSDLITRPADDHVYLRYPDWSRRGDLVVFERGELRGNIWMININ